ncbi:MAG: long-chain fatty acid--CoA ligase [Flavobacteriaceae bacterium]|jgi:long-chain acyl-CoA synthetase|nr:long-chain fatty acid--CoA ligase [Flavobacteriaceae bacterium]
MSIVRLFDILYYQLHNDPLEAALSMKTNNQWVSISTAELANRVNQVSRGLLKYGIKPGDKIALITSGNRTEWQIMDFAIQQIGAISIPIYPTISKEDTIFIFNNTQINFCFVSDENLYLKIKEIKGECPDLVSIFTFEEVKGAPHWLEIADMGKDDSTQYEVESLKDMIKADDIVTIIYTSGTTGRPKGVMLSHANIVSNVLSIDPQIVIPTKNCRTLSFLPICHVFERMVNYVFIYRSYPIYYAESIEKIAENVREVKPHLMTVVPRLVEKVYNAIYQKGISSGKLKSQIFLWALKVGQKYVPFTNRNWKHLLADTLVFKKWREGLGGDFICMICGSASLLPDLNRLFAAAGIPILEGYGLTETSPVIAVNGLSKKLFRLGTVGTVIQNTKVKIAEDGEILVKGTGIFKSYYNDDEKTHDAFTEDDWFKTGDIGRLEEGFLTITDRKKEIFKTSGGKYITPQITENYLQQSRFIEQAMVVGDGKKMPCALIQPDFEFIRKYISYKPLPLNEKASLQEIAESPIIKERIMKEVEKTNHLLGKWEKIKKIELTPEIWSIEGGELTPTLKLKRRDIKKKYIELYNRLYMDC